jgi:hypothetical protein
MKRLLKILLYTYLACHLAISMMWLIGAWRGNKAVEMLKNRNVSITKLVVMGPVAFICPEWTKNASQPETDQTSRH